MIQTWAAVEIRIPYKGEVPYKETKFPANQVQSEFWKKIEHFVIKKHGYLIVYDAKSIYINRFVYTILSEKKLSKKLSLSVNVYRVS